MRVSGRSPYAEVPLFCANLQNTAGHTTSGLIRQKQFQKNCANLSTIVQLKQGR